MAGRRANTPKNEQSLLPPRTILRKPVPTQRDQYIGVGKTESLQSNRRSLQDQDFKNSWWSPPRILHNWWLEVGCCVLAVAVLFAIVAITYPRQGLPLPQWPYSISINSLIAVLAVIMKAAVLLVTAEGLSQLKWIWFKRGRPLSDLVTYDMVSFLGLFARPVETAHST